MALIGTKEMFAKALNSDYAVGAFNVNNMEIVQGIVDAAKQEEAPVILQVSAGARKYARPAYLRKLVEAAVEDTGVDVCLHLDHGDSFELCKDCIDTGFTSVMIDGSKYPFEENIRLTKQVVEYAHEFGVPVEAELGKLSGVEDAVHVSEAEASFTVPEEAAEFVEKTGVDSLAIAIGTSHGAYKFKGTPYLDIERLKKIHKLIPDTPLVLHGSSSVPQEFVELCNEYGGHVPGARGVSEPLITEAAKYGICKVNIDTDLRLAMTASIRKFFVEHPEEFDPRKYLGPARDAIRAMVAHKMRDVLKCSGKR
jgi:fructose-bisphosphate aldolase class II